MGVSSVFAIMASGTLASVIGKLSSLTLAPGRSTIANVTCRAISTQGHPLAFQATDTLMGGIPTIPGRKKKVNVTMTIEKEKKRRKKIERAMRQLQKRSVPLKPVEEIEGDRAVLRTRDQRVRDVPEISFEESERRALLLKSWTRFRWQQHHNEITAIRVAMRRQDRALTELRAESEELFREAVEVEYEMLPITVKGPVFTPPIEDYYSPDGDYSDITKKWERTVDDQRSIAELLKRR